MWPEPSQSKVRFNLINKLSWVWNLIWFAGFLLSGTWSWSWAGDLWLDCQQLIWSSAPWQRQDCRIILVWVKIEQFKLKIVCIARYIEALLTQNNTKAHSNHCVTSFILYLFCDERGSCRGWHNPAEKSRASIDVSKGAVSSSHVPPTRRTCSDS